MRFVNLRRVGVRARVRATASRSIDTPEDRPCGEPVSLLGDGKVSVPKSMGGSCPVTGAEDRVGATPWRGKNPKRAAARFGSNPPLLVSDLGEVLHLEAEFLCDALPARLAVALFFVGWAAVGRLPVVASLEDQRQEGSGCREAVRLRLEGKALKGKTP
jgi:hypothetical protein